MFNFSFFDIFVGKEYRANDIAHMMESINTVNNDMTALLTQVEVLPIKSIVSVTEIDFSTILKCKIPLRENIQLSFIDPDIDTYVQIIIKHSDAVSTVTWPVGRILWPDGEDPELTSTTSAVDIISLYYSLDDNIYYGMAGLNFK